MLPNTPTTWLESNNPSLHQGQGDSNHNRQARWWFPRGIDLARIAPAHAQAVADLLNQQRRRSLNGNSPSNLYAALTAR